MKVLCLGLPRSGTASLTEALNILGYKNVYHGLQAFDRPDVWEFFDRAADATYSTLPTYTGQSFTRKDWDEMYQDCEAVTDAAAMFAAQMIQLYPEAKVVLTIRDFSGWYDSINEAFFNELWSIKAYFGITFVEPLMGTVGGMACRKLILGFFRAKTLSQVRRNALTIYHEHNQMVQRIVPAENLLVYRLKEGWQPLCDFLGKPVPGGVDFPRVNDGAAYKARVAKQIRDVFVRAAAKVSLWAIAIAIVFLCTFI